LSLLSAVEFTSGNLYRASALSSLAWQMCRNLELPKVSYMKLQAQSHREVLKHSIGGYNVESSIDSSYTEDLSKLCKVSQDVYWVLKANTVIDCAALLRKCDTIENITRNLNIEVDESHEYLTGLWYQLGIIVCTLSRAAIFARSGVINLAQKYLSKFMTIAAENNEIRTLPMMCFLVDLLGMVILINHTLFL